MSASPLRRAARALSRHAAGVLPADRAQWGQAMQAETDHIDRDMAALFWALGCIWASYRERSIASLSGLRVARVVLGGLIVAYVAVRLPVALKTWAIMTGLYFDPAPRSYQPVTPAVALTASISPWFLVVFLVHCALYFCAAAMLVLGWRRAPTAFVLALAVQFTGWLALLSDPLVSIAFEPAEIRRDAVTFAALAGAAAVTALLTRMTLLARAKAR